MNRNCVQLCGSLRLNPLAVILCWHLASLWSFLIIIMPKMTGISRIIGPQNGSCCFSCVVQRYITFTTRHESLFSFFLETLTIFLSNNAVHEGREHAYLYILAGEVRDLRGETAWWIHGADGCRVSLDNVILHTHTVIILRGEKINK